MVEALGQSIEKFILIAGCIVIVLMVMRQEQSDRARAKQLRRIEESNRADFRELELWVEIAGRQLNDHIAIMSGASEASKELQQRLTHIEQGITDVRDRIDEISGDRQETAEVIAELKQILRQIESFRNSP